MRLLGDDVKRPFAMPPKLFVPSNLWMVRQQLLPAAGTGTCDAANPVQKH